MIGILEWDIRAADTTLEVTGGDINIDDQNVPAIVATVIVPFNQEVLDAIDPRTTNVPRVLLNGRLTEWSSQPISALSEYATAAGGTIADLSTAWTGLQGWDVSDLFGAPLYGAASNEPQTMSLDLHVREVSYDDWEMVISLASDEALLTDWAPSSGYDILDISDAQAGLNPQQVASWVNPVLQVVVGYSLTETVYDTSALSAVYSDILDWQSFPLAWDMIRPVLEDTDLRLRVNPGGRGFTLQRPENSINNPATHAWLFLDEDCTSVKHVFSRTADWYDSAMLGNSADDIHAGYPNPGTHSRTYKEIVPDGLKPNLSMAQNIVRRSSNRGQFIDIEMPIRLGVFMRDEFSYAKDLEDGTPIEPWIVKSVSYDLNSSTMNIRGEQRY